MRELRYDDAMKVWYTQIELSDEAPQQDMVRDFVQDGAGRREGCGLSWKIITTRSLLSLRRGKKGC